MKRLSCLIALLIPILSFGQAQKNITLKSRVSYDTELSDVWGYVGQDGTEYALVGLFNGLSILSLEDPDNPIEIERIEGPQSTWRDIKTYQHFAYVSNETAGGLRIIDLENLPSTISVYDTVIAGATTMHNLWIADGFLYMVGSKSEITNGGMIICDLRVDPMKPAVVGIYDGAYVHDVYVRDNTAYAAEIDNRRLNIIDLSDKREPVSLGTRTYYRAATHNTWLNDAGTVCFTTDERTNVSVKAWDITNPSNIVLLDSIRSSISNGNAVPHNVHVLNDYLITSYYGDGIHITDASRPGNLVEVGFYDTSDFSGASFNGNWGAYPFLPSGLILASDIQEGLFVLEPTYRRAIALEGLVTDINTGLPIENVEVQLQSIAETIKSDALGMYQYAQADEGRVRISFQKLGYVSKSFELDFVAGQDLTLDVELVPAQEIELTINLIDQTSLLPIPNGQIAFSGPGQDFPIVLTADDNGQVFISDFLEGTYEIVAAKWGYAQYFREEDILAGKNEIDILMKPGYSDDFVLDQGWTISGNPSAGNWERGAPRLSTRFDIPINPPKDVEDDIGSFAYVSGLEGETYFDNDLDNGSTRLRSLPMDLTNYQQAELSYFWWMVNYIDNTNGEAGNGFLSIRMDNGIEEVELFRHEGRAFNGDRWNLQRINIGDFIELTSTMSLIVEASDPDPGNLVEVGFDSFRIIDVLATDLPGIESKAAFSLYPNPTSSWLSIKIDLQKIPNANSVKIDILDINGRIVGQFSNAYSDTINLQLGGYAPGAYLVRTTLGKDLLGVKKLLIH